MESSTAEFLIAVVAFAQTPPGTRHSHSQQAAARPSEGRAARRPVAQCTPVQSWYLRERSHRYQKFCCR